MRTAQTPNSAGGERVTGETTAVRRKREAGSAALNRWEVKSERNGKKLLLSSSAVCSADGSLSLCRAPYCT